MNRFSPKTFFLAILLLAVSLRLLGIVSRPIWYDESFSLLISQQDFAKMIVGLSADVHPFAYYIGLWAWMNMFGNSVVVARFFSILASMLDLIVLFFIAHEFFQNRKSLWLLFVLLALSPFHIHYAQEIRMYSWMSLWLHLATFVFLRARRSSNSIPWWAIFAVFAFLAQQTQTLSVFYLVALAFLPLIMRDWATLGRMALASLIAALLYLPSLGIQIDQIQNTQSYWIATPDITKFFTVLLSFTTGLPLPGVSLFWGLTITVFLFVFAVWKTISSNKKHAGFWFIYLAFVPGILMFLFSIWKPVFVERALLASAAFFLFWIYWAISEINSSRFMRQAMSVILLIASGIGLFYHLAYKEFPYAPFDTLIQSISDRATLGDLVLHSNKLTALPAFYYAPEIPVIFLADPPGNGTDTLSLQTAKILGVTARPEISSAVGNSSAIWFILFKQEIEEYTEAGVSGQPDLEWLVQNYSLEFIEVWGDVLLYHFRVVD